MRPRHPHVARLLALAGLAAISVLTRSAGADAADLQVTLPTLTAPPGATVLVPLFTTPGPGGFGIQSVEFRMEFAPGVIQASSSHADGWAQTWGPAFTHGTDAFIAVAAAGFPAIDSAGTLLNSLALTISATAPSGTDMPLTLQHVLCNEGVPSVEVVPGLLRVRATAAVAPDARGAFSLSRPAPNPVAGSARFTLTLPAPGGPVRLAIHAVDGRLVRELLDGSPGPGRHELVWDACDASGARVRPGLYFARAARGAEHLERRLVVTR